MSQQNAEIELPNGRLLSEGKRLSGFLSYANQTVRNAGESKDPIGRLFQELSLRGFDTFRDVSSLRDGEFNETAIRERLERSTAYVAVIDKHFMESDFCIKEFAIANSPEMRKAGLILIPIFVGLGETREAIEAAVWPVLRYSPTARWTGLHDTELNDDLAARAAFEALSRALPAGQGTTDGPVQLSLLTRGTIGGTGLVIDGTGVFNESAVAVGSEDDWEMLRRAVEDVERVLREHTAARSVLLRLQCHLSASAMFGFVFRTNAGWRITVATEDGEVACSPSARESIAETTFESGPFSGSGGTLAVGVDLAGRDVVAGVRAVYPKAPRGFLWAKADGEGSLHDGAVISPTANAVAHQVRTAADEHQVDLIDLFLCTPASFAVFLGTRLGSLGRPIALQEWDKTSHNYKSVFRLTEADTR